jgi:succinyl-CoA synthetase beta subunit
MNVHEHQAKDLFRKYGIPVPKNTALMSPQGA